MARVREAGGELQAAEAEYRALLEQFPQYADCYLRLACVAKLRGDTKVGRWVGGGGGAWAGWGLGDVWIRQGGRAGVGGEGG